MTLDGGEPIGEARLQGVTATITPIVAARGDTTRMSERDGCDAQSEATGPLEPAMLGAMAPR